MWFHYARTLVSVWLFIICTVFCLLVFRLRLLIVYKVLENIEETNCRLWTSYSFFFHRCWNMTHFSSTVQSQKTKNKLKEKKVILTFVIQPIWLVSVQSRKFHSSLSHHILSHLVENQIMVLLSQCSSLTTLTYRLLSIF